MGLGAGVHVHNFGIRGPLWDTPDRSNLYKIPIGYAMNLCRFLTGIGSLLFRYFSEFFVLWSDKFFDEAAHQTNYRANNLRLFASGNRLSNW